MAEIARQLVFGFGERISWGGGGVRNLLENGCNCSSNWDAPIARRVGLLPQRNVRIISRKNTTDDSNFLNYFINRGIGETFLRSKFYPDNTPLFLNMVKEETRGSREIPFRISTREREEKKKETIKIHENSDLFSRFFSSKSLINLPRLFIYSQSQPISPGDIVFNVP